MDEVIVANDPKNCLSTVVNALRNLGGPVCRVAFGDTRLQHLRTQYHTAANDSSNAPLHSCNFDASGPKRNGGLADRRSDR